MKAKILVHTSWKGGTGKTTLNLLSAKHLAKTQKVLAIDLDPNCCLSQCFGLALADRTSKDLITGMAIEPYATKVDNIDIIPGSLDMCLMSNIMDTTVINQLKKNGFLDKYDWIIIDPPGSWNSQTRNAIFAADVLVITGTLSSLDLSATEKYFEQLANCYIEANVHVVCNKYNTEKNEPGVWEKYKESFEEYLYPQPISDIKSLKYLTADPNYPIHPSVAKKLSDYVEKIIQEE